MGKFVITNDRKLIIEREDKESSNTIIKLDNLNAIYVAGNKDLENPALAIYAMTDFDEKVLLYKSEYVLKVRRAYKKLASELNKVDENFKDYCPKCINMTKIISVGWHKFPFKYVACIDFKKGFLKFKTTEDEFNKIINDWHDVTAKSL